METNSNMHQRHAFSFLEFLIVVIIIGVLTAIAIPTYGDYVTRSKTSKMLKDIRPLKAAISDYKAIHGKFMPVSKDESFIDIYGIDSPKETSKVIDKVDVKVISANKVLISILGTGSSLSLKEGQSLQLNLTGTWTKDEGIEWICKAKGQIKYAPNICKEKKEKIEEKQKELNSTPQDEQKDNSKEENTKQLD